MSMYKRPVPVGDLRFGMYVAELDRPWVGTPFAFQGFMLQTERQLQALRKFCRHVFVDSGLREARAAIPARPASQQSSAAAAFEIHGKAGYTAQSVLAHEIEAAGQPLCETATAPQHSGET